MFYLLRTALLFALLISLFWNHANDILQQVAYVRRLDLDHGLSAMKASSVCVGSNHCRDKVSLYHCITVSLYHCITVATKYHCITVSLYHCITVSLYHCITVSLYHCCDKVSLYHCITVATKYTTQHINHHWLIISHFHSSITPMCASFFPPHHALSCLAFVLVHTITPFVLTHCHAIFSWYVCSFGPHYHALCFGPLSCHIQLVCSFGPHHHAFCFGPLWSIFSWYAVLVHTITTFVLTHSNAIFSWYVCVLSTELLHACIPWILRRSNPLLRWATEQLVWWSGMWVCAMSPLSLSLSLSLFLSLSHTHTHTHTLSLSHTHTHTHTHTHSLHHTRIQGNLLATTVSTHIVHRDSLQCCTQCLAL